MSLRVGQRLGPYEILAPLGAGGMGEVYKARDTRLGREVAVKVLPSEFAADPERLRRFEQEARAAAALNHPNILVLYDIGSAVLSLRGAKGQACPEEERSDDVREAISPHSPGLPRPQGGLAVTAEVGEPVHYIVTELLEGETLRERLRGGAISPAKAVDMSVQIAQGLAAAHEKGIVHRDLKPENLWLTKDGRVKIFDFGLARLRPQEPPEQEPQTGAPTADSPTREGTVLGTVGYMSPEQARGQPADARSDIFSFGTVLYEMLSGKKAFSRDSAVDTLSAILHDDPPELDRLSSRFSPALVKLLRRCLEKKPEERFSSVNDLAFALETVAGSGDVLATRPGAALAAAGRLTRRHRAAAVSLCAFLLAAFLTGLLLWHPWKARPLPAAAIASVAPSLVALPCKVMGSRESAYLTDAIPSTLSTLLGEVQGMDTRVPPTSFEVETLKGDLAKIAQVYQVQNLVITSVTAQADRLVLNVQLVEAQTRKLRWSHQYVGATAGYNDMAREAAQGICKVMLPEAAPAVPASALTSNSEAELAFQQGKFYANRYENHGDRADFDRALKAFKRLLELSPKDAETTAWVAALFSYATLNWGHIPLAQGMAEQDVWIQKALALDPRCSEAWRARALLECQKPDADMGKEIEWTLKAAQLGPKNSLAQGTLAIQGLNTGGSLVLSVEALREALKLDPLGYSGYAFLGNYLARCGRPGEALPVLDTVLSLDPGNTLALAFKAYVLVELGRTKEAATVLKRLEAGGSPGGWLGERVRACRWLLSLAEGDDRDARTSLKAIMALFADPASQWTHLQDDIQELLPGVTRRFGGDAALDLLILSTKRGAPCPYDALMLRPDLKGLRDDPRAKDVVAKTKAPFDMLVRIMQDARARGECPKYLEKPMDDLLKDLESRGAWP